MRKILFISIIACLTVMACKKNETAPESQTTDPNLKKLTFKFHYAPKYPDATKTVDFLIATCDTSLNYHFKVSHKLKEIAFDTLITINVPKEKPLETDLFLSKASQQYVDVKLYINDIPVYSNSDKDFGSVTKVMIYKPTDY